MTTIDHRILIPAAPDVVWNYISDINRNSKWQVDCREVIFLTSKREGPGLRWRYAAPNGRECVVAVTAWYNGLGYEYYFVDGTPFRENRGRIRLQEIPEGTIVQWTFTYELGGVLGGVRNALGTSRQIDHTITESLKKLWQQLKQAAGSQSHEAKSLMRDAPDVEARSAYQPRHPSVLTHEQGEAPKNEPPIRGDDGQRIHVIDEPPFEEEDTRRRLAVTPTTDISSAVIPADFDGEPEFLNQLDDLARFEPPIDPSDTKPRKPVEVTPAAEAEPQLVSEAAEPPIDWTVEAEIDAFAAPEDEETLVDIKQPLADDETLILIKPQTEQSPLESAAATDLPRLAETEDGDTSSIWEIFGVQRPSATQQMQAAKVEPAAEPSEMPPAPPRAGLRLVLRRKLVRLRRPMA